MKNKVVRGIMVELREYSSLGDTRTACEEEAGVLNASEMTSRVSTMTSVPYVH